ncbi:transcription antitermination factor NusB [Stomatohabitans albus]|uniref:transcription antitermination factor NusB n=1 Tax=Stomatohabitans albus TaxID=3110766 RepID=UPI00300C7237
MSITRHEARHQALNVMFAADVRGVSASTLLEKTGGTSPVSGPVSTDAKIMIALYEDNRKAIDRMIASHADGWMLKRLAGVDRNAMRLAIAEMAFGDVPFEVAINEAVNLVGELGGPESPRFVNGVLGAIQRELQARDEESATASVEEADSTDLEPSGED